MRFKIFALLIVPLLSSEAIEVGSFRIEKNAFQKCAETYVSVPEGVTFIADGAFSNSAVQTVSFPKTLRYLNKSFTNCPDLTNLSFHRESPLQAMVGSFEGCSRLTQVGRFPDQTREIGERCFKGTGLTSVKFPSALKVIRAEAFKGTSVTDAFLPLSVKYVGREAFFETPLKSASLSASLLMDMKNFFPKTLKSITLLPPPQYSKSLRRFRQV